MFAWSRFAAVVVKEFVQVRRDRLTFAMMIGVPIMQLVLFGYAINMDPKGLPMAVVAAEASPFSRSLVRSLEASGYFRVVAQPATVAAAEALMAEGDVQFVLHLPADFSRKLARGDRPVVLVEADASDPAATGNAIAALQSLNQFGARARSFRAARRSAFRASRLSKSGCTDASIPRASRPTTSSRGSWAWSSP